MLVVRDGRLSGGRRSPTVGGRTPGVGLRSSDRPLRAVGVAVGDSDPPEFGWPTVSDSRWSHPRCRGSVLEPAPAPSLSETATHPMHAIPIVPFQHRNFCDEPSAEWGV